MVKEKWKKLKNFKNVVNNMYEVSNYGNVRNCNTKEELHKKIANKKHHPYFAVYLKHKTGKSEWVLVHQLVAFCFLKIKNKYSIYTEIVPDHLDNNGLNNYFENLEYKTRGENVKSAHEQGFINNSCDSNMNAIVSNSRVIEICKLLEKGLSYSEILDQMKLPNTKQYRTLLIRIKNKNAWTDISKTFNIPLRVMSESQKYNYDKIPDIVKLIKDGFSNSQICDIIFPDERKRDAKMIFINNIINKTIYKDYLKTLNY